MGTLQSFLDNFFHTTLKMGVPAANSDSALLREHAYFDTGNINYVVPKANLEQNHFGFTRLEEKGLGFFDYNVLSSWPNELDDSSVSAVTLILACLSGCLLISLLVKVAISDRAYARFTSTLPVGIQNASFAQKGKNRPSVLPLTHKPTHLSTPPPSLSCSPDLSDLELYDSPRNLRMDTIYTLVDDLQTSLKSWTAGGTQNFTGNVKVP